MGVGFVIWSRLFGVDLGLEMFGSFSGLQADAGGQACDLVLAETKPCQTDQA